MSDFGALKKLATVITRQSGSLFEYPIDKQKKILNKLGDPVDDIERSYYQYLCQAKLNGKVISALLNVASLPMLIYYSLKKGDPLECDHVDSVFVSEGIDENVIPSGLRKEFDSWKTINELKENYTQEDRKYFTRLFKRHPFSWHFLFKCLVKIRMYSYLINSYTPSAIIVCGEYSFTSSVLTSYCGKQGLLHIDVMHGEKLFFIRDSYFRFHRCYVWSSFYKRLFISLMAEPNQFIIEVPASIVLGNGLEYNKCFDYKYYLGSETGEALVTISNALRQLVNKGFVVAIRPHPRYSNINEVKSLFTTSKVCIEDGQKVSIEDSILQTRSVISLYSTVLNQAFNSNVRIVIDDLSNPDMFVKLKDLQYVMLDMEHSLLSEEIGN